MGGKGRKGKRRTKAGREGGRKRRDNDEDRGREGGGEKASGRESKMRS